MSTRERPIDRGRSLAKADRERAGTDIRQSRLRLGRSIAVTARAAGMSRAQAGRVERAELTSVSLEQLARLGAAVGLDVRVRTYPGPDPIRDAGQTKVLGRLRDLLPPSVEMRMEVPLLEAGGQRAWDAVLTNLVDPNGARASLQVEVETRLADWQAQLRRIALKTRDASVESVLVVVADTHRNRDAMRLVAPLIADDFPVSARTALQALRQGRHPGGSAIILI
jgi:transcriptional regulator with XRE-family HTH domain